MRGGLEREGKLRARVLDFTIFAQRHAEQVMGRRETWLRFQKTSIEIAGVGPIAVAMRRDRVFPQRSGHRRVERCRIAVLDRRLHSFEHGNEVAGIAGNVVDKRWAIMRMKRGDRRSRSRGPLRQRDADACGQADEINQHIGVDIGDRSRAELARFALHQCHVEALGTATR
jgi:hypothetical protein